MRGFLIAAMITAAAPAAANPFAAALDQACRDLPGELVQPWPGAPVIRCLSDDTHEDRMRDLRGLDLGQIRGVAPVPIPLPQQ